MRRKRRQQTGDRGDRGRAEEPRSKKRWGHPPEFRIRVVREVLDGHMTRPEAARVFGVAVSTIADWMRRYRARGMDGLRGERRGPPAGTKPGSVVKREAVTETEVWRILHESGLMPETREAASGLALDARREFARHLVGIPLRCALDRSRLTDRALKRRCPPHIPDVRPAIPRRLQQRARAGRHLLRVVSVAPPH